MELNARARWSNSAYFISQSSLDTAMQVQRLLVKNIDVIELKSTKSTNSLLKSVVVNLQPAKVPIVWIKSYRSIFRVMV
jgi:hypothetical protein